MKVNQIVQITGQLETINRELERLDIVHVISMFQNGFSADNIANYTVDVLVEEDR